MIKDWKPIKDYPNYEVNQQGEVRSLKYRSHIGVTRQLTPMKTHKGYLTVALYRDGKRTIRPIHRLVAQTFIPNPENLPQVNHKNENKQDNSVRNLEWCSVSYNVNYGTRNDALNIPVVQLTKLGEVVKVWRSAADAKRELRIHNISNCCRGKRKTVGGYVWRYA